MSMWPSCGCAVEVKNRRKFMPARRGERRGEYIVDTVKDSHEGLRRFKDAALRVS